MYWIIFIKIKIITLINNKSSGFIGPATDQMGSDGIPLSTKYYNNCYSSSNWNLFYGHNHTLNSQELLFFWSNIYDSRLISRKELFLMLYLEFGNGSRRHFPLKNIWSTFSWHSACGNEQVNKIFPNNLIFLQRQQQITRHVRKFQSGEPSYVYPLSTLSHLYGICNWPHIPG